MGTAVAECDCWTMRITLCLLLGLLLAACESQPTQQPAPDTDEINPAAAPAGPDADINASLEPIASAPPHSGQAPRFVGRWAAEERLCATATWRFSENELHTPAGSVCRFTEVREVPGGYDIAARCTAEAPERDDLIRLRFPESAGGMLFESASVADAGLVRCEVAE